MNVLRASPHTAYRAGTVLIRLMVGAVFLTEGLQKFLYPAVRGAGRFERIGFSNAEFWGAFVGTFETGCGALILLGLLTPLAAVPIAVGGLCSVDAVLSGRSERFRAGLVVSARGIDASEDEGGPSKLPGNWGRGRGT